MFFSKLNSKEVYWIKTEVSIPAIASHTYAIIGVPSPSVPEGTHVRPAFIIARDGAHQITMYYISNYGISVYNAYSGTSSATSCEIWWLATTGFTTDYIIQ